MRLWNTLVMAGCGLALSMSLAACEKKDEAKGDDKAKTEGAAKAGGGDKKEEKKAALPTETMNMALDEGKSAIPATIDVPKGSTTFNDSPKRIRINFGDGEHFGLQVGEGNEYNTNLKETAKGLAENKYGNTNTILKQTDDLLVYKMKHEDAKEANFKFTMLVKLGDKTWVCEQGNYGGYDQAQIDRQMAACKTLKAK